MYYDSVEDSARDLVTVLSGAEGDGDGDDVDDDHIGADDERARLSSWNDRVESSFGRIVASLAEESTSTTPETPPPPSSSDDGDYGNNEGSSGSKDDSSAMNTAASMLRGRLLRLMRSRLRIAHAERGGDRFDVDASSENGEESKTNFILSRASTTDDEGGTDGVASDVAAAIVGCGLDSVVAAKDAGDVSTIVEILRSSKNLVRLNNFRIDAMGEKDRAVVEYENSPVVGPLQSRGMLEVYLASLVRARGGMNDEESIPNGAALTSGEDEDAGNDGGADAGMESCGDRQRTANEVARYASVVLLHLIRGSGQTLSTVVDDLDGIEILARELTRQNPVPNLLPVVRIVHYVIGTRPDALRRIDVALLAAQSGGAGGNAGGDLASVLVATLAWAVRSQPAFPGTGADRRSELVEEILRVLFAVNVIRSKSGEQEAEEDTLTQLGIILCDILQLPNADTRAYGCKLAAVDLLMDSPPNYANYLILNGGIRPLLVVLTLQVNAVVVERRGGGRQDTVLLMPILAVLDKMAKASGEVRRLVKEEIFPNDVEALTGDEKVDDSDDGVVGSSSIPQNDRMGPRDAPVGTLRWKLIQLMTWTTDSRVKRCAGELLWTLCDGDASPSEFVTRTGFGNAVHMLGIKGLVSLPDEATTV